MGFPPSFGQKLSRYIQQKDLLHIFDHIITTFSLFGIYIYDIYIYIYAHTCLSIILHIYYITYNFTYNIDTFHANHSQCRRKLHSEARRRRSKPSIQATACEQHLGVSAETVVVLVMKSGGVYHKQW